MTHSFLHIAVIVFIFFQSFFVISFTTGQIFFFLKFVAEDLLFLSSNFSI